MGKSPGKWLKNLLFRKSSNSKKSRKDEVSTGGEASPCLVVAGSQVISRPLTVSSISNLKEEKGLVPSVVNNGIKSEKTAVSEFQTSNGRQKKGAIRVHTIIRGHEELQALIKLQAFTRGRLVRRQAVATLRCVYGIVKMQALVRGWKARSSGFSFDVIKHLDLSGVSMGWQKISAPAFICKLLFSKPPLSLSLQMKYAQGEPNCVWNWLEMWTLSNFWRPNQKIERSTQLKSGNAMESEPETPKHTAQKKLAAGTDFLMTNATEHERCKHNLKESILLVADQKRPQSELEKVKCNLRMLSRVSAQLTSQSKKSKQSLGPFSSLKEDLPERRVFDFAEDAKEVHSVPEAMTDVKTDCKPGYKANNNVDTALEPTEAGRENNSDEDNFAKSIGAVQSSILGKSNCPSPSDELCLADEQSWNKTPKASKNCSAFMKSEFSENSLLGTQVLPSYMAATESVKAKLRVQCSPRLSSDDTDKTGITRRHSLPSTLNGKLSPLSPRTHRSVQTKSKGDRSLRSSRDENEKLNRVEWRR